MLAAGNTPNNSGYSDLLGEVIMDDLAHVMNFFTGIVPDLGLEARRRLEVDLHFKYYAYHALPPGMADNAQLVSAQARLLEAMTGCRAALEDDPDFDRYRLLVGHDSVTPIMWEKPGFDYQAATQERSAGIDALVASVTDETGDAWLARLERFVETRSDDGATFLGLQEFIKKLAAAQPAILLGWMPKLSDRLASWLPGMLHGLWEAGKGAAIDPLIETWVAEDRHLSSIAYYLQSAEAFRFDLLKTIKAAKRGISCCVLLVDAAPLIPGMLLFEAYYLYERFRLIAEGVTGAPDWAAMLDADGEYYGEAMPAHQALAKLFDGDLPALQDAIQTVAAPVRQVSLVLQGEEGDPPTRLGIQTEWAVHRARMEA